MNILILNPILFSAQNNVIPKVNSIKDCMIYNIALGFNQLGHNVTLITVEEYKPQRDEVYEINVVFMHSAFKRVFLPNALPLPLRLLCYLQRNKKNFDLIISSEIFSFSSLFAAMIAPRRTIVWHELAVHIRKMRGVPSYFWYNIVAKLFFRKVRVVARSENAKNFAEKYVRCVSDLTVEHGINLNKFQYSSQKKKQFIVVGQLVPRKNISSILEKFKRFIMNKQFIDYKLIIVGRGELEEELKGQAVMLDIIENVEFAGFKTHEELNHIISESQALLIDTRQDNNMVSIPESIVSGTPVVTNFVPTNAYTIEKHKLGIVANWTEKDLEEMVKNNSYFVDNCISFRENLSNVNTAKSLINDFKNNL